MEIGEVAATKLIGSPGPRRRATKGVDVAFARQIAEGPSACRGARRCGCHDRQAVGGLRRRGRHPLVEVNPWCTPDDRILALDGKVTLDGNADFRHPTTRGSGTRTPPIRWN